MLIKSHNKAQPVATFGLITRLLLLLQSLLLLRLLSLLLLLLLSLLLSLLLPLLLLLPGGIYFMQIYGAQRATDCSDSKTFFIRSRIPLDGHTLTDTHTDTRIINSFKR